MINIGGGTETDSLNTLIHISKSEPELISGIKIDLNILDLDDYVPFFAISSAEELTSERGSLRGFDFICRHIFCSSGNQSSAPATITVGNIRLTVNTIGPLVVPERISVSFFSFLSFSPAFKSFSPST